MSDKSDLIKPEDLLARDGYRLSEKEINGVADTYTRYYKYRSYRSGLIKNFRNYSFEDFLTLSRELFWNSIATKSDDLAALGLDLSIPFARKETMDILGRVASLKIKPRIVGDEIDSLGIKILQGMYKKWAFRSNAEVETFWELLYGFVNGTVCSYVGYNNDEVQRRYLKSYDPANGAYEITTKNEKPINDVTKEIVPIEDIYLPKIWERNIQKQGNLIWKTQMDEADFRAQYGKYAMSKYVFPGNRVAEDSLFFRLLGGSGTVTANKIEVMKDYDWIKDEYKIVASGITLNRLSGKGKFDFSPMPFNHKMAPFTWGIMGPLDEKLAYGLSTPFAVKDPHKILNVGFNMTVEREFRAIDPVILTSDIESPDLIYGQHKVIPVNDINAYKEFKLQEPSTAFYTMMNSLQQNMSADAQGGDASAVPSRQPKSAREVIEINQMKQQALANTTTMYYNILRQQVMLVLKTAMQFYTMDKYKDSDKSAIRTIMAHDMPLSLGGMGDIKIRIVKDKQPDMALFLEGIKTSVMSGKNTEIIEVPVDFLQNLDFYISKIEMDTDQPNALEMQSFVDNVITPMLNTYVPMGLADPAKVMMRHMEKMDESVSDYASENVLNSLNGKGTAPSSPLEPGQTATPGGTAGNLGQSVTGTMFGGQKNQPLPINA